MTLRLLSLKDSYQSSSDDLIGHFFLPCLDSALKYDRAVGYFRSSIFAVINESLIDFAIRRGRIRLICSPSLDEGDARVIQESIADRRRRVAASIDRDVSELLDIRNSNSGTAILATLIAQNALDIKIAIPRNSNGIFHDKLGIFIDSSGDAVTFRGSINETRQAWHESGNYESFEVFSTFGSESDIARARRHIGEFEMLWMNITKDLDVVDFPETPKQKLVKAAASSLASLRTTHLPQTSQGRQPREHQTAVLRSWAKADFRGLVAHATGSGKTFTAILAIREHVLRGQPCVVLVPSSLLLKQWQRELRAEIPAITLLLVGDGNVKWRDHGLLRHFLEVRDPNLPVVIVAVMKSACDPYFISSCKSSHDLLIVCDEVHQIGSKENSAIMSIDASKRLGLSATPNRYGDPDGSQRILDYFGPVLTPIYTLADGIRDKNLCEYQYRPFLVSLSDSEVSEWEVLSKQISRLIAMKASGGQQLDVSARLDSLVYRRLALAKKASEKIPSALSIIRNHYKAGHRWLVYAEDKEHLCALREALIGFDAPIFSYFSGIETDSVASMAWFKHQGGILLSIRCLDEGIDIPEISHAIILASSQNPRQYIQRRGRVLRQHADKSFATIFDAIVRVSEDDWDGREDEDNLRVSSFQRSELARAFAFAKDALNATAEYEVQQIAIACGVVNSETDINSGMEADENE